MLVLIADKVPAHGVSALTDLGCEVLNRPELGADDLPAALAESGAAVVIVRSTKVTTAAFEGSPNLRLVIRAGAGVNTIDLATATEKSVAVANCPGKNSIAVAELAMGLIIALDRRIVDAVSDLRAGRWRKKEYGKAAGVYGRNLGLVGFGAIARHVAVRAGAFGMNVSTFDPFVDQGAANDLGVTVVGSLDELLPTSDVLSIHVPYGKKTHHLIGPAEIAKMKDGAMLIHASRGGVVDDQALKAAVEAGKLRAGLDVYEEEPAGGDAQMSSPLAKVPGVYGTPHIGASTDQAQTATFDEVVRIIKGYADDSTVANLVNEVSPRPPA